MVQNSSNSPHDARREIDRIPLDSDMMAALQDPAHPGHKAASARRRELYESVYSDADTPVVVDDDPSLRSNDRGFLAPPPDPKEYRFDPVPSGVPYDAALERRARGWFHKVGVPQWLARNVAREWNRTIENPPDADRIASDAATTEKSLRRQWGDQYDAKIEAARSLIRSFKNDEMTDLLDRSGMANSEYLIRQLVALAEGRGTK
jgi:hypothetical protein